jgi:Na+-transporting NADH:ubiquinone oxidoreductase subunit C
MERDSTFNTFKTAILLALVCSIAVSSLAVGLRSTQQLKKEEFRQQNILKAAGLLPDDSDISGSEVGALFRQHIKPVVLDFEEDKITKRYAAGDAAIEVASALRDKKLSRAIDGSKTTGRDIAGIRRRETYATIYEVRDDGQLKTLVLPIRGYGLWSTLWGFIAIDFSHASSDPTSLTVTGLTYYKHGETPGLGGEVDNPLWKGKWPGKRVYDANWHVNLEVAKNGEGDYHVDAISGATLTSNGVSNMLSYWLGEYGYGPYVKSLLPVDDQSESVDSKPGQN